MDYQTRPRRSPDQRARDYDEQNREAARIILADASRYPGIMTEWAEMMLAKKRPLHWQEQTKTIETPRTLNPKGNV